MYTIQNNYCNCNCFYFYFEDMYVYMSMRTCIPMTINGYDHKTANVSFYYSLNCMCKHACTHLG